MKLKEQIKTALLLAIGLIIHYVTPGIFFGMKMDFLLIAIFISIMINPKFENYILTALLGGLFSAMTTTFPGGQIPNIVDKIISTYVVYLMVKTFKNSLDNKAIVGMIGFIGTFISGSIFLLSARFMLGLESVSIGLVYSVVLPAAAINAGGLLFLYKIVGRAVRMYETA